MGKGKILDLDAIRQASANLDRIAADHPELLGPSTTEEWEEVLNEQISNPERRQKLAANRQAELRQRRKAEGVKRETIWLSDNHRAALKQRFPGPRAGIDWEHVVEAALTPTPIATDATDTRIHGLVESVQAETK